MKIRSLDFEPVNFELKESFSFGNQTIDELEYVLVKIETADGTIGLGEAAPYWDPNGETQGSALGALKLVKPKIEGRNATQLNAINEIWDENCQRAFSARAAVDMALFDIQGKEYNVPVFELLGGSQGQVRRPIPISLGVDIGRIEKVLPTTENDLFKVKADNRIDRLDRIGRILNGEKDDPTVAIDVNQTWETAEEANENLASLEFDPDWIEQPVDASDKDGLKRVKATVMADESFYTRTDYLHLKNQVEMFNIKISKAGGLSKSGFLAHICKEDNRRFVIGSMLESPIGTMAAYHLAKAWNPVWMEAGSQNIRGVDDPFTTDKRAISSKDVRGLGVKPSDLEDYYPFSG